MPLPRPQDYRSLLTRHTEPERQVVVVIPAHERGDGRGQRSLDLTLASLCAQNYPSELIEVRVVDDQSPVAVTLPTLRPSRTRLISLESRSEHWGKAAAVNAAAHDLPPDSLLFLLDSDMVLEPSHIAQLASWASAHPAALAFGYKSIVERYIDDPGQVMALCLRGQWKDVAQGPHRPHAWLEDLVDATDGLTAAGPDVFRAVTGATLMMPSSLWQRVGGYDPLMVTAEDTELGYRLVQAGALVVPVSDAAAWHLGATTMERHRERMLEHNRPLLADRVPLLRHLRQSAYSRRWRVPTVVVDFTVDEEHADAIRATVEAILAGKLGADAVVGLVGSWPSAGRYSPVLDETPGLRMLQRHFASEQRVAFLSTYRSGVWPAPYHVEAPGRTPLAGVRRLLDLLEQKGVAAAVALVPDSDDLACAAWRTSALERLRAEGYPASDRTEAELARRVGRMWGCWWVSASDLGLGLGAATYKADPLLTRPGGGPAAAYVRTAVGAWAASGYRAPVAKSIASGLGRGAVRRTRRVAKRYLSRAAAKL